MTLTKKTWLYLIVLMLVGTPLLATGVGTLLTQGFWRVERERVLDDLERSRALLDTRVEGYLATAADWAIWTDSYDYVRGDNPAYADDNLFDGVAETLGVDLLWLSDLAGAEVGATRSAAGALPEADLTRVAVQVLAEAGPVSGLMTLAGEPWLVAAAPIVRSDGSGPAAGALVVARHLDDALLAEIGTQLRFSLQLDLQGAAPEATVRPASNGEIRGVLPLTGADGRRVGDLVVTMPRPVRAQALRSVAAVVALILAASVTAAGLVIGALERHLLARLRRLVGGVAAIRDGRRLDARLEPEGDDELAGLAIGINDMLGALEASLQDLDESEARYELTASGVNDGIWEWDVAADELALSPRFREILGFDAEATREPVEPWWARLHPDDEPRVRDALVGHLRGDRDLFEVEHRILHRDGSYRWALLRGLAVRGEDGRAHRMAGSLTDITLRGRFDPLTGLPNRRVFLERLEHVHALCRRHPERTAALLFLDLDRFKEVNDSLGHPVGDRLLVEVGTRLTGAVRGTDTVARLGGDEFVVLLEQTDRASVDGLLARLTEALAEPFEIDGARIYSGASVGVVTDFADYASAEDLLRGADIAMYHAKDSEHAHAHLSPDMIDSVQARHRIGNELRGAGARGELELHYQPVVELASGRVVGAEALLRWRRSGALVSPAEFIPVAESNGEILPIGAWVIDEGCRQLAQWQAEGLALTLSVNVSVRQLRPDLVDTVRAALERHPGARGGFAIEVTETALIGALDHASAILDELRALGVTVMLDDFGTGHSSLSYLHTLPIDVIKVDRAFVARLEEDATSREIVRAMATLTEALGLRLVAEGVETPEQRDLLLSLGCRQAQGYLYAAPLVTRAFEERLAAAPA